MQQAQAFYGVRCAICQEKALKQALKMIFPQHNSARRTQKQGDFHAVDDGWQLTIGEYFRDAWDCF
ncbi:hypothetical protein WQE_22908 [Paraburkholderia hospita]|jgi:hypothetical protein|uniref:Uncharacterized protein n=1 Tax=Paraburkholderia hospita TaxID=169430 RepID=A0ABN0FJ12_9BURK|nr:hypothetical protein WQE_22908 [Paraburkholderia hospita]